MREVGEFLRRIPGSCRDKLCGRIRYGGTHASQINRACYLLGEWRDRCRKLVEADEVGIDRGIHVVIISIDRNFTDDEHATTRAPLAKVFIFVLVFADRPAQSSRAGK